MEAIIGGDFNMDNIIIVNFYSERWY